MFAAAQTPDTTVLAAFAVGFVSFISPCVLPLVPGYLSAISGASIAELREGRALRHTLLPSLLFCLSFSVMFVLLGMSATKIGSTLQDNKDTLDHIAGALIVAMGAFFILTPFIPRLNREWRPDALISRAGSGGPLVAGAAFAVAWTPCVGPTLSSILTAASTSSSVYDGGVLLGFYSLGLAVPFLLTAVAFTRATTAFRWLRDHYTIITAISGAILIAVGILIFTNQLTVLNAHAQHLTHKLGLDFIYNLLPPRRAGEPGPVPLWAQPARPSPPNPLGPVSDEPTSTPARSPRAGRARGRSSAASPAKARSATTRPPPARRPPRGSRGRRR